MSILITNCSIESILTYLYKFFGDGKVDMNIQFTINRSQLIGPDHK
jgi:hypothetical protein